MKTVHKFLLRKRGVVCPLMLPIGSSVTRIAVQDGSPYAWVWLDTSLPYDHRYEFLVVATGDLVSDEDFWPINTFDGPRDSGLIWHGLMKCGVPDPKAAMEAHAHHA